MLLKLIRHVSMFREKVAIRLSVAKQAVHHRAGQRAVGAGPHQHGEVRLLHGAVHVNVDRHDLRAALLSRASRGS
jgi:hypothetical protein